MGISFAPYHVVDSLLLLNPRHSAPLPAGIGANSYSNGATGSNSHDITASRKESMKRCADEHVEAARKIIDEDVRHSRRLLECVQTTVILGWFHVSIACLHCCVFGGGD
jgi:hypothetical protein